MASRLAALFVALLLTACAGAQRPAPDRARIGVEAAAHAVAMMDGAMARYITEEGARPHDPAAFQARFAPYVTRVLAARAHLVLAERLADAWKHGAASACPVRFALDEVVADLDLVRDAAASVGLSIPDTYMAAARTLAGAALELAPACRAGADGGPDA
jgi:hypothetical protein